MTCTVRIEKERKKNKRTPLLLFSNGVPWSQYRFKEEEAIHVLLAVVPDLYRSSTLVPLCYRVTQITGPLVTGYKLTVSQKLSHILQGSVTKPLKTVWNGF